MSAREYLSVGGDWLTTRTTGDDDTTPATLDSRLGCDLCWLNISHTVARCEVERERGRQ